jgi:hypothetical protein
LTATPHCQGTATIRAALLCYNIYHAGDTEKQHKVEQVLCAKGIMRYSYTALVLAAAIVGQVAAGPHPRHAQFHDKKDVALDVEK